MPPRNRHLLTIECPACHEPLEPNGRGRTYCSNACRQAAYRRRLFTLWPATVHVIRNTRPDPKPAPKPARKRGMLRQK